MRNDRQTNDQFKYSPVKRWLYFVLLRITTLAKEIALKNKKQPVTNVNYITHRRPSHRCATKTLSLSVLVRVCIYYNICKCLQMHHFIFKLEPPNNTNFDIWCKVMRLFILKKIVIQSLVVVVSLHLFFCKEDWRSTKEKKTHSYQ